MLIDRMHLTFMKIRILLLSGIPIEYRAFHRWTNSREWIRTFFFFLMTTVFIISISYELLFV